MREYFVERFGICLQKTKWPSRRKPSLKFKKIILSLASLLLLSACGSKVEVTSYPAPTVAAGKVNGTAVETTAITNATGPALWQNISPPGVSTDFNNPPNNYGFSTLAVDPATPTTLYTGTNYQGLYKSINGGSSW